ncbi:MAG: hypothetical protein IIA59_13190 [Candidatus Marinimicrobia bacterium]|nr:hypothetical protein [Candidatus Neomarinimicrobiota bacterium]
MNDIDRTAAPEANDAVRETSDIFSLLDVLLLIARNRRLVLKISGSVMGIALAVAIFSPAQYTASAKIIREVETGSGSGLSGLDALRGLGLSFGGGSIGLSPESYPEIIRSREVRLAVANTVYTFDDLGKSMTFVEYYSRPPGLLKGFAKGVVNVTIKLPSTIMSLVRSSRGGPAVADRNMGILYLSKDEQKAIKWLSEVLAVRVNRNSGIMAISVTTHNPSLSVGLVSTYIKHLRIRIRDIYTFKARQNLEFIQNQFATAAGELMLVENELARFIDRNQNIQTSTLKAERGRLQRELNFKVQVYSDLQNQLTQSEIELQRSKPVLTFIEVPLQPLHPSGPKRTLTVLLGIFLGLVSAGIVVIFRAITLGAGISESSQAKLTEIRESLQIKRRNR